MVHEREEDYPYGLTKDEYSAISAEDIYDVFEIYDTVDEALTSILNTYGEEMAAKAKNEAEEEIAMTKVEIEGVRNNQIERGKLPDYTEHASFFTIPNSMKYFCWLPSGRVVVVEFY